MEREHFSFAEVAAEIGCNAGALERAVEARRFEIQADPKRGRLGHRSIAQTGFRAILVGDLPRIFEDCRISPSALPDLPGFPGLVRFDDAERATHAKVRQDAATGPRPEIFDERLEQLRVRVVTVRALAAEGRERALVDLRYLAAEASPATGSVAVASWRQDQAAIRIAAEDAATRNASPPRAKRAKA